MLRLPSSLAALCLTITAHAAGQYDDKFRQLEELLPTANTIRADYTIRATLDEANRSISGFETITYHNNSPDTLSYL